MTEAAQLRDQAVSAERRGDLAGAKQLMAAAVDAAPGDAPLLNSAGAAHLRWGDNAQAAALFRKARGAAPETLDFAINLAIALGRQAKHGAAARMLSQAESIGEDSARYWSARGNAERRAGMLAEAERSYDRAVGLDRSSLRAAHGKARVALERGRGDAVALFERAMKIGTNEADLWLGKAMALDAAGEAVAARELIEAILRQAPGWVEGLDLLAQLRLAGGETAFADHYAAAAGADRAGQAVYAAWIKALAGNDRFADAADIAAQARASGGQQDYFALVEAIHAGSAGDNERAGKLFGAFDDGAPDWRVPYARHLIRVQRIEEAETKLAAAVGDDVGHIGAWALRDVCWRLRDDERHEWLHGQDGLFGTLEIEVDARIEAAIAFLEKLHDTSAQPLSQSVRGGSQTRGGLFQRTEPELAGLHDAIVAALERHRRGLPDADPDHPLLRHRGSEWRIAHSWSVRLAGSGYHTSHIHPQGVLSSALYLGLPDDLGEDGAGHLEIGRPPPDLLTDLGPLATVEPAIGKLALFPSTLYHGTRPFRHGRRLSVAFDVHAGEIP